MDVKQQNPLVLQNLIQAEAAVIGSMIIDEACVADVMLKIAPSHFIHAEYRHLFTAIRGLWQSQQPIDAVTVLDAAGKQYQDLIAELITVTPTAANVMKYAEILRKESQLHQIHGLAAALTEAVELDEARKLSEQIYQLLSERQDLRITTWADGLRDFFDRLGDPTPPNYLPWGIPALDANLTAELSDYVILGAWPSSGKTALALQFGMHMAAKGYRVGFFSLETKDRKLIDRIVAQNSGVNLFKIKHKRLVSDDWDQIVKNVGPTASYPMDIIRAAAMQVTDIQAITMSRRYQIVIIDYIQLVRSSGYNRTEEVSRVSMELHTMCQRLDVCLIGLSQLHRADKSDAPRDPTMADLRESGQLEQDAEIIMLLNHKDAKQRKLIVDKNKDGDAAEVNLVFDAAHVRFGQQFGTPENEDDDEEDQPRRRHQGARSKR